MELHGGGVWLKSAEGKGSTFTVALPMTSARRGRGEAVMGPILVVDDDALSLESEFLGTEGYRVVASDNARGAFWSGKKVT